MQKVLFPIDNFQQVEDSILKFDSEGEFYMVLVLRRRKDTREGGASDEQRLIKHFFVYDKEYFQRKRESIIALCLQNNARAYILPQRRTCSCVLWALHDKVSETLKSGAMNVHFDHLIRSCVAGMHDTPPGRKWHKRWVIDLDEDDENTVDIARRWRSEHGAIASDAFLISHYANWLAYQLQKALLPMENSHIYAEAREYMPKPNPNYTPDAVQILHTPHGWHVVTPPFNRDLAAMQKYFGNAYPRGEWIKQDGLTLVFAPASVMAEEIETLRLSKREEVEQFQQTKTKETKRRKANVAV